MRRRYRFSTTAAVLLAATAMSTPAQAGATNVTSGPTITWANCEPVGSYRIACSIQWTGGTAPFTIRWFNHGSPTSSYWNDKSWMQIGCRPQVSIDVVLTDATGASDTAVNGSCACLADPP